ncbi:MAG: hypothetical protein PHN39_01635 [Candidatus Pacebacteria bacterium]|nr:hypothetical protein [Candidatus Paceibacterota bacterium]
MKEVFSFENNPEKKNEKISLTKFFDSIKQRIIDEISNFLKGSEDPDIREAENRLSKSIDNSKSAGEYYEFLIPHSLKKPDKEYKASQPLKKAPLFESERTLVKEIKKIKKLLIDEEYQEAKKTLSNRNEEFIGEVTEQKKEQEGLTEQYRKFCFQKDNAIIEELVFNDLKGDSNMALAKLVFTNQDGLKLDLNALLPEYSLFAPGEMRKYKAELDKEQAKIIYHPQRADLHSYQGNKNSNGEFACSRSGVVTYGDLTKKGGPLSLLHEISHSWQNIYYDSSGRYDFENFYKKIALGLSLLSAFQREVAQGGWTPEEFEELVRKPQIESLLKEGVEVNLEDYKNLNKDLGPNEFKLKTMSEGVFIIKGEKVSEWVKNYAREERDAWAHAIRVLRFLRRRGIDLEPELKSLNDFKEQIDQNLRTYQDYLDDLIEFSGRGVRFAKNLKKDK